MDPKCLKCGGCCKASFIAMENIDLDRGDRLELIRYYKYHGCEPMEKVIGGKRVLTICIPIPCEHVDQDSGLCRIYDNRPTVCREYCCEKIIREEIVKIGEDIGFHRNDK